MTTIFVDTELQLRDMLDCIADIKPNITLSSRPLVFIDLEGVNLSRHGTVAIMQLSIPPLDTAYLIDVHVLKERAFSTEATERLTLREVLESNQWPKVFFDVRNDSDALFSHFGIRLTSVIDIQLLELATRRGMKKVVNGLGRCIDNDLPMSATERMQRSQLKNTGKAHFAPEQGGTYEVFLERPLATAIIDYCVQDIAVMPKLLAYYGGKLRTDNGLARSIQEETTARIELSKQPNYDGKGRHMAIAPRLGRQRTQDLPFPINLVCSGELDRLCTITDVAS